MKGEIGMTCLLWAERYRGHTNFGVYIPEYIVLVKSNGNTVKERIEYKIKMSSLSKATDKSIAAAFDPIIRALKLCSPCTLIYTTHADMSLMRRLLVNCYPEVEVEKELVLNKSEFSRITKGKPASNSNSRLSRANKAFTAAISGCTEDISINWPEYVAKLNEESNSIEQISTDNIEAEEETPEITDTIDTTDTEVLSDSSNTEDTVDNEETQFVRSKASRVFHLVTCKSAQRIKNWDLVKMTLQDTVGNEPCKKCLKNFYSRYGIEPPVEDTEGMPDNIVNTEDSTNVTQDTTDEPEVTQAESVTSSAELEVQPVDLTVGCGNAKIEYTGDIDPLGKYLVNLCSKYGLFCEIIGTNLIVLTAAGGWKFDYTSRPIQLYHQNYRTYGNSKMNTDYHLQSGSLLAPIDAISYIISHDNKRIELELSKLFGNT